MSSEKKAFDAWQWLLRQRSGRILMLWERRRLVELLKQTGAQTILQIGKCSLSFPKIALPFSTIVRLSSFENVKNFDVFSSVQQCGIENQSFQVIILQHTLDWADDPKKIFDEVWRILQPNGLCFILISNRSWFAQKILGDKNYRSSLKDLQKIHRKDLRQYWLDKGFFEIYKQGILGMMVWRMRYFNVFAFLGLTQLIVLKKELVGVRMKSVTGKVKIMGLAPTQVARSSNSDVA